MHTLCLLDIKVHSTVWHDVASYHCSCSSYTLNMRKLNIFYLSLLSPWQVNEPDYNSMSSGKLKYLPPRFMTINTAVEQLLEAEEGKKEVNTVIHFHSDIIHQDSCVIYSFILMHLSHNHPSIPCTSASAILSGILHETDTRSRHGSTWTTDTEGTCVIQSKGWLYWNGFVLVWLRWWH